MKKETERILLQFVLCNTMFWLFLSFKRTAALETLQKGNCSRTSKIDLYQSYLVVHTIMHPFTRAKIEWLYLYKEDIAQHDFRNNIQEQAAYEFEKMLKNPIFAASGIKDSKK